MSAGQSGGKGADQSQDAELRADIERTRQELGETVEALAAKTDVTARARNKASKAKEQAAARAAQAKEQAAARAAQARGQATARADQALDEITEKTARARQKLLSATRPAAEQVQGSAEVAGAGVWQALPDQVQEAVRQAATTARRSNPAVLAAIAAGALLACILIVRRSRK